MKASVIIPNLNGAGWLRDSIESIWAQTEQDFELIVIDNGSTDESLEIAHSYCGNPPLPPDRKQREYRFFPCGQPRHRHGQRRVYGLVQ